MSEYIETTARWGKRFVEVLDPTMQDKILRVYFEQSLDTLDDPMETPLPCDVTVGHVTIRKGVPLRTLVARMKVLYEMATGQVKIKGDENMQ